MSTTVRFLRRGDTHPITAVFFGKYALRDAAKLAAEMEADQSIVWVRVDD